jgi:urease accessory protein
MADPRKLLRSLQMGDSSFPSGGFAFSWGLETLKADGIVCDRSGVEAFARSQLRWRWATADRPFLRRAATASDVVELAGLDCEVEVMTLARELREGSRRAGRSLLRAHGSMETPGVSAYRSAMADGNALGHLPVAQGVVWKGMGMAIDEIEAVSAYAVAAGIAQAAVRLALLGPLDAQSMLSALREDMEAVLVEKPPERPFAFTPAAEIAVMRHERGDARLFAN